MFDNTKSRCVSARGRLDPRAKAIARSFFVCAAVSLLISTTIAQGPAEGPAASAVSSFTAQAHYVMGTVLEIQIPASAGSSGKVFARLFGIARRHDEIFSTFKPESPVSQFNRKSRSREPFTAPAEMTELVTISQQLRGQTGGAFDIAVGPLVRLWKEAVRRQRWPTAEAIFAARQIIGGSQVVVDQAAQSLTARDDGVELDFNGIAKGYCVDKMAEALRRAGINQAFINFGESSVYALGAGPEGRAWSVAVRDPRQPSRTTLRLLLSNMALGSSGSYEHSGRIAGRTVNHIVDPRTGHPANSQAAVTVIAPSGTVADALSTALVVLAPHEGLKLLEGFPGAEAVIFYREHGRWKRVMSGGMRQFID